MSLLHKAIKLAVDAHFLQNDKSGDPYILHPLAVMNNCCGEEEMVIAILHDVLEDTFVTTDELFDIGLTAEMVEAIVALTRNKDEPYEAYLGRVKKNDLALRVKLQDLAHNMSRNKYLADRKEAKRLLEKYYKAWEYLRKE
jgi:(p)ppGpp synthase/HD superfamily hydrolase